MGWFSPDSEEAKSHETVNSSPHKAKLTHEVIAAAASYAAAHAYEKHVKENGKPANHAQAVELLAGLTGGFIDRLVETKGLDTIDKESAKRDAKKRAEAKLSASGEFN
jgi:hypothetical protein